MKRVSNLKDSIMMPPPKARPKSRSDTSEELKKNLTESITNISENSLIHEEFQKYFKDLEEHTSEQKKNEDDLLSISKSTSSLNFDKSNNMAHIQHNQHSSATNTNKLAFNFNLINYNYNCTQFSDEEESSETLVNLEKLRKNLTEEAQDRKELKNTSSCNSYCSHHQYKQFIKLPTPMKKREIKAFASNLLGYISEHEFDSSLVCLKIKIQTRHNDYRNKALNLDYYKECLIKMQNELLARICLYNKLNIGNSNLIIENGKYEMINRKRKRTNDESEANVRSNSSRESSDSDNSWDSLRKV